jgi:hypothetical protein
MRFLLLKNPGRRQALVSEPTALSIQLLNLQQQELDLGLGIHVVLRFITSNSM